jgi:FtsP/CotA-like multicopper oxidase with cupredoxin domain
MSRKERTMTEVSRREFVAGAAAAVAGIPMAGIVGRHAVAADEALLLSWLSHEIMPGKPTHDMMGFAREGPPPVLRMRQGEPFAIDVINRLEEASTVHWHGLRIANAMDGVPYLTQNPIAPGDTVRYSFTPPDAGTFWYHPHCNTLEQMARGMTGILVVEEAEDPGFDADIPLNIRDFRLGDDGQFIDFYTARNAARGGTLGTISTVNWQIEPEYALPAGTLVRLRLAATDLTRVGTYELVGGEAQVIALDANPVPSAMPPAGLILAPGQRADIALRMPDDEGESVVLSLQTPSDVRPLARFRAMGTSAHRSLAELKPLPTNPVSLPDLNTAQTVDFLFGWSPGGNAPVTSICGDLGYRFWSINREAWRGDIPGPAEALAVFRMGQSYILRLRNETPNDHPIHLHGLTFQLLRSNKRTLPQLWTDTALLQSQETMEVALVADNAGDWAFHCHVIEHQKTGLSGFIRVEA